MHSDLFQYPYQASFKEQTTSRDAAKKIEKSGRAATLRNMVLDTLMDMGPLTADECAFLMKEDILSIRPRFSELNKQHKIRYAGITRKNASGVSAKVWVA